MTEELDQMPIKLYNIVRPSESYEDGIDTDIFDLIFVQTKENKTQFEEFKQLWKDTKCPIFITSDDDLMLFLTEYIDDPLSEDKYYTYKSMFNWFVGSNKNKYFNIINITFPPVRNTVFTRILKVRITVEYINMSVTE